MTTPAQEIGKKYDKKKLRYSLLPMQALQEVVKVLEFGAAKYSEHNWRHVENAEERYRDAALRHQLEPHVLIHSMDNESFLYHDAHAICCLLFKLQLMLERKAVREAQKDNGDSDSEALDPSANAGGPAAETGPSSYPKFADRLQRNASPLPSLRWRNPADDPL